MQCYQSKCREAGKCLAGGSAEEKRHERQCYRGREGPCQALYPVQHGRPLQCCSGKDIMKVKGSSLSDETFEMLIFMRGNKHHLRASMIPIISAVLKVFLSTFYSQYKE